MKKNLSFRQQLLFNAYQQYFSKFPGQTYVNITFAIVKEINGISKRTEKAITEERAKKDFFHFFQHLNKHEIFYKGYVPFWLFFEKNPNLRKGIHLHALMDRINPEMIPLLDQKCNKKFGDCKVKPRDQYTIPYLAEKCVWPQLIHYEYFEINCDTRGKIETKS